MTRLQQMVWKLAATLPEARNVALAGASGLIVRGVVDRPSRDVDLFATDTDEVDRLTPALIDALANSGCDVTVVSARWGHTRLEVRGMGESTNVDIGVQIRLDPVERTPAGPVLSQDDLAAGKLIALFDRAAERDYLDVAALTATAYTIGELCDLAEARQPRFDRKQLAGQLQQFRYAPADFGGETVYNEIRHAIQGWLEDLV